MAVITADESGDVLGDDGRNVLQGDEEDNYLDGFGGRDWVFGKGGNDILIFDNADQMLHGGEGFDTLRLSSAAGGLVSLKGSPNIVSIEAIDMTSVGYTLRLTAEDVCRISDNDALVITSVPPGAFNSFNTIDPGTGWQFDGYSENGRFLQFSQSGAHLTIENTIQLIGLNDVLP